MKDPGNITLEAWLPSVEEFKTTTKPKGAYTSFEIAKKMGWSATSMYKKLKVMTDTGRLTYIKPFYLLNIVTKKI